MIPRIAIFFDWLNQWGGAERLLQNIIATFPECDLYTAVYDKTKTKWLTKIPKSSLLNHFNFFKTNSYISIPLHPFYVESFDLSEYDIVISLTSMFGKNLICRPETLFICYSLTPNRYVYKLSSNFFQKLYQSFDRPSSARPDLFISISKHISSRLKTHFNRKSIIIYPPVAEKFFCRPSKSKKYYLIVSRLLRHKNIDLVIDTFKKIDQNLLVVGSGRHQAYFQKKSFGFSNIKFLGHVSDKRLISIYQHAKALICPQLEDFGLTPLESQAAGTPVIAYDRGGIKETVIDHKTGIFFNTLSPHCLKKTISIFEKLVINPIHCQKNAVKYSQKKFMINFRQFINNAWQDHHRKLNS